VAGQDIGVRDFASLLRREGIKLVAERVEREDMVPALVELGMPLAQGFVFAAPRAIRADVLGTARLRHAG
jgi:cyclic-di-GMP phosphodiesterase TipF (flagellum assembly factor)